MIDRVKEAISQNKENAAKIPGPKTSLLEKLPGN